VLTATDRKVGIVWMLPGLYLFLERDAVWKRKGRGIARILMRGSMRALPWEHPMEKDDSHPCRSGRALRERELHAALLDPAT